ncbi:hypothetical protein Tco_0445218, partial [Tanacetum coccineum]
TARMVVRDPPAMSLGLSASMAEVAAMSESTFLEDSEEDDDEKNEEIEESMDSDSVSEDAEDEGLTTEDEDPATEDEGLSAGVEVPDDKGHSVESDGLGLEEEEEEEAIPRGQQRQELALEEDDVYSKFETDPEDGMVYIDVPIYPPPAPPVQTPSSPEWTSGSLPISPSHSDVLSPISSPIIPLIVLSPVATPAAVGTEGFLTELGAQVEMQGELIRDHAVRLEESSPALFERYDMDIGELFTRSEAVRDEIFSQRYRFRSLKYEQERVTVTFRAIWRPVLALESWAGQTNAQRAALWHAISDVQGENQDL